jgi:hypothetical protein
VGGQQQSVKFQAGRIEQFLQISIGPLADRGVCVCVCVCVCVWCVCVVNVCVCGVCVCVCVCHGVCLPFSLYVSLSLRLHVPARSRLLVRLKPAFAACILRHRWTELEAVYPALAYAQFTVFPAAHIVSHIVLDRAMPTAGLKTVIPIIRLPSTRRLSP